MTDFFGRERNMNLIRIGIIAGAHIFVLGIVYLVSGIGGSEASDERVATAGANGLVTWSNKDPGAQSTTVSPSGGIDSRAADLDGFNAGDAILEARTGAPQISSRKRFAPTRPGGSPEVAPPANPSVDSAFNDGPVFSSEQGGANQQPSSIVASQSSSQVIRYTVKGGDSLWGIATRFKVKIDELYAVNPGLNVNIQPGQTLNVPRQTSTAPMASPPASSIPKIEGSTYTVKSGDSLSRIAARQSVTLSALRAANNLSGDLIRVGQELIIPSGGGGVSGAQTNVGRRKQGLQVVVAQGDTISSIAIRYNVSAADLIVYNDIENPRLINPGQTLLIPSSGGNVSQPVSSQANSQPVPRSARQAIERPAAQSLPTLPQRDEPLLLVDEDDTLTDESLIEQPVIPIEE